MLRLVSWNWSLPLLILVAAGFSKARPGDAASLFCGKMMPELAATLAKRGSEPARAPASESGFKSGRDFKALTSWSLDWLHRTQGWMDELESISGGNGPRRHLSKIAVQWVSLHAAAERERSKEFDSMIQGIALLQAGAEKEHCRRGDKP